MINVFHCSISGPVPAASSGADCLEGRETPLTSCSQKRQKWTDLSSTQVLSHLIYGQHDYFLKYSQNWYSNWYLYVKEGSRSVHFLQAFRPTTATAPLTASSVQLSWLPPRSPLSPPTAGPSTAGTGSSSGRWRRGGTMGRWWWRSRHSGARFHPTERSSASECRYCIRAEYTVLLYVYANHVTK